MTNGYFKEKKLKKKTRAKTTSAKNFDVNVEKPHSQ